MPGLIVALPLLFAQAPAAPPTPAASTTAATAPASGQPGAAAGKAAEPPANPLGTLVMFLPVGVLFYLMIYRPQKQQERKRKEMIDQMGRNTRVVTSGGIHGTVVSIDKESDTVLIRLGADPGLKVEFSRAAVVRVIEAGDKDKKDAG